MRHYFSIFRHCARYVNTLVFFSRRSNQKFIPGTGFECLHMNLVGFVVDALCSKIWRNLSICLKFFEICFEGSHLCRGKKIPKMVILVFVIAPFSHTKKIDGSNLTFIQYYITDKNKKNIRPCQKIILRPSPKKLECFFCQ